MDGSIDPRRVVARRIRELVDRVAAIPGPAMSIVERTALYGVLHHRHRTLPLDFAFLADVCDDVLASIVLTLIHERHVACPRFHQQLS
jgi:hypothetical protein